MNSTETPPVPQELPKRSVVVLLADLFFAPRFADVIRAMGGAPVIVETPEALIEAVDLRFPVLALVDLSTPGDWQGALRRLRLRPHSRGLPIYAFGSHVDAATLRDARQAGADHAWARSRMMEELPKVVAQHISPEATFPSGWDAPLSPAARLGVAAFNAGDYFGQHEHFEHAWLEETRPVRAMYQGILQVGVALLLIERGSWAGALKMFRRGLPRLRTLPPICQGVHIGELRAAAEAIHAEITALGPARIHEFPSSRFPQIVVD